MRPRLLRPPVAGFLTGKYRPGVSVESASARNLEQLPALLAVQNLTLTHDDIRLLTTASAWRGGSTVACDAPGDSGGGGTLRSSAMI